MSKSVTRFLVWWGAGLAALLPGFLSRWLGIAPDLVILGIDADTFEVGAGRSGDLSEPLGRVARSDSDARRQIHDLIAGAGLSGAPLAIRLTAGQVLQKDLALPVAVTENLRQVLEFEMERHTPFAAAQVYYGGIVLGPASDAGKVQVRLAAVPRETVDHAIDVAQNVGLSPALIGIGDPLLGLDRRINLLPGAAAAAGFPRRDRALLGLAVALAVVALVLPGIRQAVSLAIVESRIAGLEPAAKQAIGLRAQINAALAGTGTVARAKHAAPSAVGLLEELSVRLPDDTWLAQMNMVGGELEIEGTSTSAAALVSILEASPLIASVGFRTPVTRNNLTDREHFNLSLGAAAR